MKLLSKPRGGARDELNSNIRCIEILLEAEHGIAGFGWIVTLDVLK